MTGGVAGDIFSMVDGSSAAQNLRGVLKGRKATTISAVQPAGHPFLIAYLRRIYPNRALVAVANGVKAQEALAQDVDTWSPLLSSATTPPDALESNNAPAAETANFSKPLFYPAWEVLPHESKLPHADVISERLETLLALQGNGPTARTGSLCVVTQVAALIQRTLSPGAMASSSRRLAPRDRVEPLGLAAWLEERGYEVEAQVSQKGEVAIRGGIVDVFPLTSPWPVRLEFFGNEIDSIRYFDPNTQISKEPIDAVSLAPNGELGLLRRALEAEEAAESQDGPPISEGRASESDSTSTGNSGTRGLAPTELRKPFSTLLDHLPASAIFVLLEPEALAEHAGECAQRIAPGDPFFIDWNEFLATAASRGMTLISVVEDALYGEESIPFPLASLEAFRPLAAQPPDFVVAEAQRHEFFNQMHRWLRQGMALRVFCNNEGEATRFHEIWTDFGLAALGENTAPGGEKTPYPEPITHLGALGRGFLFESARLAVVTDAELFGRHKVVRSRRLKSPHASAARSALEINFTEFEEGDFVVHLQHGVGRYAGLGPMPAGRGKKSATVPLVEGGECLILEYAPTEPGQPSPKLYVPLTEAHLVSKYVGAGRARPPLNTLGGARWGKAMAQAEAAVRDLAGELLSMQAARASQAGHPFEPDTPWQREFEAAFIYEETPDQMRAIVETKQDMEAAKPMDRLICGDVGYGKTEVAIRAAFKAVMGGKQAALLVPTTILAEQHYHTFRERMADYPVRIEQLSRFVTRAAQKRILRNAAEGSVDILIGTHRLLQEDVTFKDLGLVIVDEEQRFGVLHKEKLKLLRQLVDVLTLSATPIPRTLQMALIGARDMSAIETPPQDRLPIETIVAQYNEPLIRDAIERELQRQGQVYFLHNRVMDIDAVAGRIQALVPHARIAIGHGQMEADELERVMTRFIAGEADILVCTTIIESGIDIPNANTIIINRADRFGLSDLYQLRGRVGRYRHQAYAYLLLPRHAALLTDVRKRISAIRQHSSLGSGFRIAMRDLEIRGAGNLLGPQQSGHITAVGFELYCQLLKQSVRALQGEKVKPRIDVSTRFDFLSSDPARGSEPADGMSPRARSVKRTPALAVPREVAVRLPAEDSESAGAEERAPLIHGKAFLPLAYVGNPRHRIEMHQKLAQVDDKGSLARVREEFADRFGKLPEAAENLLKVAELKAVAAERGFSSIETRGAKLILTRAGEPILVDGKFPRLKSKTPKAKLAEVKRMISLLTPAS